MSAIHVGVVMCNGLNPDTGEILEAVFDIQRNTERNYKYVIANQDGEVLILCTHPIKLDMDGDDIGNLYSVAPSGTYHTLSDGTRVTVWCEEL